MDTPRARSIDELFSQVKDYDLVLTADAPLADALTARIQEPRLGIFATTPRRLVRDQRQNTELLEKSDLFIETVQRTELNWKHAIFLIDAIIDCWKHTGELEAIRDYERFDTEATRTVLDIIRETDNLFGAMAAHDIDDDDDVDVAVVGRHGFNALDRSVVPDDADTVDYLTDERRELPEFNIYGNQASIVQAVMEAIDERASEDVAVVVDPDSDYPALLESRLETAGVPYMRERTIDETRPMRLFISLLRRAVEDDIRVEDVRPLLPVFDLEISREYERHRLDRVDGDNAAAMQDLLATAAAGSLADAVQLLRERTTLEMEAVAELLDELGLSGEPVTDERVDHLAYFLSAYDERSERSRRGVLLASATSAAYMDRPIVFYLGMSSGWMRDVRDRPWIDAEAEEAKHLTDFTTLLQNGEQQHFLVQDREMNQDVTPVLYLGEFTDGTIESFRDLPHTRLTVATKETEEGFAHQDIGVPVEEETAFSQSRLNTFVTSPRDYFFDQLVTDIDEVYFTRGSVLHDFAEFYVNYPGIVEEEGLDRFVDIMMEEIGPHLDAAQEPLYRTQFTVGCRTLMQFLDREEQDGDDLDGYEEPWFAENMFADRFGVDITSPITERWFANRELGVQGIVDLILNRTHLVDHKSGMNMPSQRGMVQHGHVDRFEDDPDFQAPMYLAHHRTVAPEEALQFTYFHFLHNQGDVVAGTPELDDCLATMTYFPRTYEEQLQDEHAYAYLNSANTRKKLLEPLGQDWFKSVVADLDIGEERWDKDEMVVEHHDALMELCQEQLSIGRGEDLTERQLEKATKSVLKQLSYYRQEHFFAEDLDRFETFVTEQLEKLNEYKHSKFPVGDADREDMNHPDLVMS